MANVDDIIYKCNKCETSSRYKPNLVRHIRNYHMLRELLDQESYNKLGNDVRSARSDGPANQNMYSEKALIESFITYDYKPKDAVYENPTKPLRLRKYICFHEDCEFSTIEPKRFLLHRNNYHKDKIYFLCCNICEYATISQGNINRHIKTHRINEKRKNNTNDRKKGNINRHMKTHRINEKRKNNMNDRKKGNNFQHERHFPPVNNAESPAASSPNPAGNRSTSDGREIYRGAAPVRNCNYINNNANCSYKLPSTSSKNFYRDTSVGDWESQRGSTNYNNENEYHYPNFPTGSPFVDESPTFSHDQIGQGLSNASVNQHPEEMYIQKGHQFDNQYVDKYSADANPVNFYSVAENDAGPYFASQFNAETSRASKTPRDNQYVDNYPDANLVNFYSVAENDAGPYFASEFDAETSRASKTPRDNRYANNLEKSSLYLGFQQLHTFEDQQNNVIPTSLFSPPRRIQHQAYNGQYNLIDHGKNDSGTYFLLDL